MSQVESVVRCGPAIATVQPSDSVAKAAQAMADRNIGALVVVDESSQVVGIVSERDILKCFARSLDALPELRVADIMTRDVLWCRRTARLADIHRLMVERRIRHLPVLEEGRPVAMISSRDVMAHLMSELAGMKEAAEQIAKLLKCLRTLNVDEVIRVGAAEVPHIFGAKRFTLSFDGGTDCLAVCRRGCPCPPSEEAVWDAAAEAGPLRQDVPEVCRRQGCLGQRVLVPLSLRHPPEGQPPAKREASYLCLCDWASQEDLGTELFWYKASLVQDILSTTLSNAARYRETHRRMAIDALTGISTRRAMQTKLQEEVNRGLRYGNPFCLAFVDVDHFKGINDDAGHAAGDEVLRGVARVIASGSRTTDLPARYGGDEFVLLMPQTRLEEGVSVVERLRKEVGAKLLRPDAQPVTLSCGVVEWDHEAKGDELIARADAELYRAKRAGRNVVVFSAT